MWKHGVLPALIAAVWLSGSSPAFAQAPVPAAMTTSLQTFLSIGRDQSAYAGEAVQPHDGSHDFDFNVGTWRTHVQILPKPLTGSTAWIKAEGTVTIRKIWEGQGLIEEIKVDGPNVHFEGLTVYMYNPQSKQWSQIFADKTKGSFEPPTIGEFKNGRGELYGTDTVDGRSVLVRGLWSGITPNSHRYEIAYSADGGRSWETNFIGNLERLKP